MLQRTRPIPEHRSPYHDALKSLAFGLAANESMDTKKVVDVVQFA